MEKNNPYHSYPSSFDSTQSWQREDAKWLAPRQRWMWHCSRTSTSSSHTDTDIPCPGFFNFFVFIYFKPGIPTSDHTHRPTAPDSRVPLSRDDLHHQNFRVTQSQSAIRSTVWKGSLTHDFGSCRPGARVEWEKSVAQLGWGCGGVSGWKLRPMYLGPFTQGGRGLQDYALKNPQRNKVAIMTRNSHSLASIWLLESWSFLSSYLGFTHPPIGPSLMWVSFKRWPLISKSTSSLSEWSLGRSM